MTCICYPGATHGYRFYFNLYFFLSFSIFLYLPLFCFSMSAAAAWQQTQIIKSSIPHNLNTRFVVPILSALPDIYIISIVRWERCFFFASSFGRAHSVEDIGRERDHHHLLFARIHATNIIGRLALLYVFYHVHLCSSHSTCDFIAKSYDFAHK